MLISVHITWYDEIYNVIWYDVGLDYVIEIVQYNNI